MNCQWNISIVRTMGVSNYIHFQNYFFSDCGGVANQVAYRNCTVSMNGTWYNNTCFLPTDPMFDDVTKLTNNSQSFVPVPATDEYFQWVHMVETKKVLIKLTGHNKELYPSHSRSTWVGMFRVLIVSSDIADYYVEESREPTSSSQLA